MDMEVINRRSGLSLLFYAFYTILYGSVVSVIFFLCYHGS